MSNGSSSIRDGLPLFFVYLRLTGRGVLTEKECTYRLLELKSLREILGATPQISSHFGTLFPEYHPPGICGRKFRTSRKTRSFLIFIKINVKIYIES